MAGRSAFAVWRRTHALVLLRTPICSACRESAHNATSEWMKRVCHVRLGRPQTPDVSASMCVEVERKGCKNRNRLSPQIAVVVRPSWPCHRFAVDTFTPAWTCYMKKIKRCLMVSSRIGFRTRLLEDALAGTSISRSNHPTRQLHLTFAKFFGNRCREQPQVLGRKRFC